MRIWTQKRLALAAALSAAFVGPGCMDEGEPEPQPVEMVVSALGGGDCGGTPAGVFGNDSNATFTIVVTGANESTGQIETLLKTSRSVSASSPAFTVADVPQGDGHSLELFASSSSDPLLKWYAKSPAVTVRQRDTVSVDLLLTRHGGFSRINTSASNLLPNTIFPATALLGDGRVLVTGGFTRVIDEGGKPVLKDPDNRAFIFDPRTGAVTASANAMTTGRAGHGMVYMPQSGKVLIAGGTKRLDIDSTKAFPLRYARTNGVKSYELYDPATDTFTAVVDADSATRLSRAFPQLNLLADGTVSITGGGEWRPDEDAGYRVVDVFDPEKATLLPTLNFKGFEVRAGHSVTFLRNVDGRSQLLVWGGTSDASGRRVAELLNQSSRQREGVDGSFAEITIKGDKPFTWFHQMTRLSGNRFLLTGGTRYDGGTNEMLAPAADEAWLLTFSDGGGPTIETQKVAGLGAGRTFHGAYTSDFVKVAVVGGWAGIDAVATDKIQLFDGGTSQWALATQTEIDGFETRGGMGSLMMPTGSVLMVGGAERLASQGSAQCAMGQVYTPSTVPSP